MGGQGGLAVLAALASLVTLSGLGPLGLPASAQVPSPNQPEAIPAQRGLTPPPCPRIGPAGTIQPLRLQPGQVAAKNARGCLSAEDAVYGANGCPLRFCGQRTPRLQLPAP